MSRRQELEDMEMSIELNEATQIAQAAVGHDRELGDAETDAGVQK